MRRILVSVLACVLFNGCIGCFAPQDAIADKAFITAIADQKMMAAQDEAMERTLLRDAQAKGIAAIDAKRIEVGKALEGLTGPNGKPLLDWTQAEKINAAFGQVRADFDFAVQALDDAITLKYRQRNIPIQISEAYLDYSDVRRDFLEYGFQGFAEGMGKDMPALLDTFSGQITKMKEAGLPTSLLDLQTWLSTRVSGATSGKLSPLKLPASLLKCPK
jgi:hypothetical protein